MSDLRSSSACIQQDVIESRANIREEIDEIKLFQQENIHGPFSHAALEDGLCFPHQPREKSYSSILRESSIPNSTHEDFNLEESFKSFNLLSEGNEFSAESNSQYSAKRFFSPELSQHSFDCYSFNCSSIDESHLPCSRFFPMASPSYLNGCSPQLSRADSAGSQSFLDSPRSILENGSAKQTVQTLKKNKSSNSTSQASNFPPQLHFPMLDVVPPLHPDPMMPSSSSRLLNSFFSIADFFNPPNCFFPSTVDFPASVGSTSPRLNRSPGVEPQQSNKLYKTELCRSWEETGVCRYAGKCQFAHGKEELREVERHPKYKTEMCRTFMRDGTCPYGTRCRFIHKPKKEQREKKAKSLLEREKESSAVDVKLSKRLPVFENLVAGKI